MSLLRTDNNVASLFLRLSLGVVMFPHGAQKMLGWWGGDGYEATMQVFTQQMGIPYIFALLAFVAEFFGAIGLIFGFLTRIAAFGIGCVMAVAAYKAHWPTFFMNWTGQQAGEGFEYHILAVGMALALMVLGGGAASVDRALTGRRAGPLKSRP